ncbi:YodL domain-containing protein [Anaerocolumna sp.]|uniref:YodL domain-containing protein n=1 Tax=Anaerocolumna sp. TaxID=2041569 RepID=UPI003FA48A24
MPDPDVSIADRNAYGYLSDELLPLSKERAAELFEQDLTVYLLYEDNTEAMAFDREDIDNHNGLFGIEKADWLALQEYEEMKGDGKLSPEMSEQLFLEHSKDAFAIYQLKDGDELRDYRFEGLDWLKSRELLVERDNYNFVYTEPFTQYANQRDRLEEIWERFNNDHPADFKGHSLSVSDIVAIKQNGVVTYHYCDSYDFKELSKFAEPAPIVPDNFLTGEKVETPRGSFSLADMTKEQMAAAGYGYHHSSDDGAYHIMGNGTRAFAIRNEDNPLRAAEMSTEQNYNQIDGILNNQPTVAQLEEDAKSGKPISLMDLLDATRREEKQSVMEQLKTKPLQEKEKLKKAPSVGAEMER